MLIGLFILIFYHK